MKMILLNKLKSVEMTRLDIVTSYLMVTEIHDLLVAAGEKVEDRELVNMALNGLPLQWETFV